ncbi:MAG: glycosyltransferase family 4 protein [Janthinobacterium lividum]
MHIAFISYEYPPDTAVGGIATYIKQAASMLSSRGHQVEVFTASKTRSGTENENGILVHRIQDIGAQSDGTQDFPARVARIFAQRHEAAAFDVLEGPEYRAEAREAVKFVPGIPLVVKLHTPSYLLRSMNTSLYSPAHRILSAAKSLLRRERPFYDYEPEEDIERSHCLDADEVAAPSRSIGEEVIQGWGLDAERVAYYPLSYVPNERLLRIPIQTQTNVVTYYGRLEMRKGVVDLAEAIPLILRQCPAARFQFVGRSLPSPKMGTDMKAFLAQKLARYGDAVKFLNPIPPEEIPDLLSSTDICVFPSLWESFGYTCLESMAAGRGVVATSPSGMAEMLQEGDTQYGLLVPPKSPNEIARTVIDLLQNPERRMRFGSEARQRVLDHYSLNQVGELQESSYRRAIQRRTAAGPRP